MGHIFIQVASYRDPELKLTIEDALDKAENPDRLKFAVCWQFHPDDKFTTEQRKVLSNEQIQVLEVDLSETPSRGTCWARHSIQQLYDGEEYTLQLDSHMRFVKGWDVLLINMLKDLQEKGHSKPLITSYAPSYEPSDDPAGRKIEVWRMDFDRFAPEGWIATAPSLIPNWQELKEPVPARFYSAHFAFTIGTFATEVQHDPQFYFHGEEPSIAVRAFTHGYDLFHPHIIICWHEYMRNGKTKQWDDDREWVTRNNLSHLRYRQLFGMDGLEMQDLSPYGLGSERSLDEYIKYSGVDISNRKIQQYTRDRFLAPNPIFQNENAYKDSFYPFFRHCLDLEAKAFAEDDYDFWVVSFENNDGTVLHRQDADVNEIKHLMETAKSDGGWIRLWREYKGVVPDKAVVWAHSKSKEWLNRHEFNIK